MLHQRVQILNEIADVQHQRKSSLLPGLSRCDVLQAQLREAFDTALHQRNTLAGRVSELADKVFAQRASPQGASEEFLAKAQEMASDLRARLAAFDGQLDGAEADLAHVRAKAQKFIQALQQASNDEVGLLEELSALQTALKRFVAAVNEAGFEVTLPPMPAVQSASAPAPGQAAAPAAASATTHDAPSQAHAPAPAQAAAAPSDKPTSRRRVTFDTLSPADDAVPMAFLGAAASVGKEQVALPATLQEDVDSMGDPVELQLKLQRLLERMADMQRDLAEEKQAMQRAVEANAAVREYKQNMVKAA